MDIVREVILGLILVAAAGLIVRGVYMWEPGAAYVVGGVLLAAAGVFFLGEAD